MGLCPGRQVTRSLLFTTRVLKGTILSKAFTQVSSPTPGAPKLIICTRTSGLGCQ